MPVARPAPPTSHRYAAAGNVIISYPPDRIATNAALKWRNCRTGEYMTFYHLPPLPRHRHQRWRR